MGKEFQELIRSRRITPNNTTLKNPQANVRHERIHQTMAECFQTYKTINLDNAYDVRDKMLQAVAWVMRSADLGQTKSLSRQLVYRINMVVDKPIITNWELVR